MSRWAIGVDLGGTNIRAAEVDEDGTVGATASVPVNWSAEPEEPFAQLAAIVARVIDARDSLPEGIGVGATGPVDVSTGFIDNPHTLPAHLNGDARRPLEIRFGLPVRFENDANAAALAEAGFGGGRSSSVVVCVTVGTGIGVGVVRQGVPYRGAKGWHPEAGHMTVDPRGPACYCGTNGCLESIASGSAILAAGVAAGIVGTGGTAKDVHDAANKGDQAAAGILANARNALGIAARNLIAVHAADALIFAGGALGDTAPLLEIVNRSIGSGPFVPPGGVLVTESALGGLAGCIGAASLIVNNPSFIGGSSSPQPPRGPQ